jgi:hypothetical protein
MLYIFVCSSLTCANTQKGLYCFRQQLPKHNPYLAAPDPDNSSDEDTSMTLLKPYDHKTLAANLLQSKEFEITTETISPEQQKETNKINEDYEDLKLAAWGQPKGEEKKETLTDQQALNQDQFDEEVDWENAEEDSEDERRDKNFLVYTNNCKQIPDQVLRYCFDKKTKPMLYSDYGQFEETKIPGCKRCGERRIFEFQINSQILEHFDELIELEWGVLCVYSCPNSCDPQEGKIYEGEWVMLQNSPDK